MYGRCPNWKEDITDHEENRIEEVERNQKDGKGREFVSKATSL